MPTYTPRLGLPRPTLDELADGPDGFGDLTDVLDPRTVIYASGTLALRPAPGIAGRLHWATDTRTLSYDDGSAWRPVSGAAAAAAALAVGDVGMVGQIRAGRQLTASDFTAMGLAQPIALWNLADLTSLGSDARALANKGAVPFGVGINGLAASAAVFAGSTSQALYIPDSGAADPYRIRTGSWGCWFRTAKRGTHQFLMARSGASGSWGLRVDVSNVAIGAVSYDGTNWAVTASGLLGVSDVCDDRWHFTVNTFDGSRQVLYVDGVPEATALFGALIFVAAVPLNIGGFGADAGTATGLPYYGRVDEAFVTADVLSEDQVRGLYCAAIPHGLGVTPGAVRLSVHRRRKGAPLAVADFTAQPLRLHNFTAGALTDQGSGSQTLTNNGTALAVAGADGTLAGAYSFAGTAQSLSATDAGLPSGTAARSYGAWFKTTGAAGNQMILHWGGPVGSPDVRLMTVSGSIFCASVTDGITGAYVADGQWHLAVVIEDNAAGDGLRRKLFLDGRLVGASTVLNAITLGGANRFRVGALTDASTGYTGQIDGAFVCGYALAQDDVLRLYAKASQDLGASPKEPGPHVERLDADRLLWVADTLESQHTIDIGVVI